MNTFSAVQLERLKVHVLPFGAEWTSTTRRPLATVRDGLDFLASMRARGDFWAGLAPTSPEDTYPLDLAALRELLPSAPLTSDVAAEDFLRALGLSDSELSELVTGLDEPNFFDLAIQAAFAEARPQSVARALERILQTNADVLATQCYVGRVATSRGLVRTVGAMMGVALLLVGTACPPQSSQPTPQPTPGQGSATSGASSTPTPTPQPPPDPASGATTLTPVAPTPPTPAPANPPAQRPHPPPSPAPRYKGVSPRRRTAATPT